jgi:hypothetical protein
MEVFQFYQWDSARLSALSNLNAVRLSVSELRSTPDRYAMSAQEIGDFVKGMLKIAAVPLVEDEDVEGAAAAPRLHASVTTLRVADLYSVRVEVEMTDRVWLTRQTEGHAIDATTWHQGASFVSNRHELKESSKQELGKVLTKFLNDFLAVNQPVFGEGVGKG